MRVNKTAATAVALLAPFVLLLVIGAVTGSSDLGSREFTFIGVVWVVGLAVAWWPRKPRPPAG